MSRLGTISSFNATRPARTLFAPFTLSGHGLHGNRHCSVTVAPAESGGLRFLHTPSGITIPAHVDYVGDLSLATTLVNGSVSLSTVEHLLSALFGLGVDHALISVDAEEIPILDGSAAPWVNVISRVGLIDLPDTPNTYNPSKTKNYIKILKPVEIRQEGRSENLGKSPSIRVSPYRGLSINYTIDFPVPSIGCQSMELVITPDRYRRELANARTFCLKSEIDFMHSRGLALGGSLDNAIVYDENGPLNETLRYKNEALRHKMLDLVGDLALLGAPLMGHVEAYKAGHATHVALIRKLLATPEAWTIEKATTRATTGSTGSTIGLFQPDFSPKLEAV